MGTRLRRLSIVLGAVATVLVAVILGLFLFRTALAETLILATLKANGLPAPGLTLSRFAWDEIVIRDLKVGTAGELTAQSLRVPLKPGALLGGSMQQAIGAIEIEGLVLRLDLTGDGPPFGSLQPLLAREDGDEGGEGQVPAFVLTSARIEADTDFGPVTATLNGDGGTSSDGGLEAALDIALASPMGRLQSRLRATRSRDGRLEGSLEITEGAITLPAKQAGVAAEIGGLDGDLTFTFDDGQLLSLSTDLAITDIGLAAAAFKTARITLELLPRLLTAKGEVRSADGLLDANFALRVEDYRETPNLTLDLTAVANAEAEIFTLVDFPLSQGTARVNLAATGKLPPIPGLATGLGVGPAEPAEQLAARPFDWAASGSARGRLELALENMNYRDRIEGVSAKVSSEITLAADGIQLALAEDGWASAERVSAAWLDQIGLPRELIQLLQSGLSLRLPAEAVPPPRLTLRPGEAGNQVTASGRIDLALTGKGSRRPRAAVVGDARLLFDERFALAEIEAVRVSLSLGKLALGNRAVAGLSLRRATLTAAVAGKPDALQGSAEIGVDAGRARFGDLSARGIKLRLPLRVGLSGRGFEAAVAQPGRLSLSRAAFGDDLTLSKPLTVTIPSGTLVLSLPTPEETGGGRLAHDITLVLGPTKLTVARAGEDPLGIDLTLGRLRLLGEQESGGIYQGQARLSGGAITLPERQIALTGVSAKTTFDGSLDDAEASFSVASIKNSEEPPLFAPLSASGTLRRRGAILELEAEAKIPSEFVTGEPVTLAISGQHDLTSGTGEARLLPVTIDFAPGALQPSDLAPSLTEIDAVSGSLAAALNAAWSQTTLQATAGLRVSDLSLSLGKIAAQGINLDLQLSSLLPVASPPNQRLTVQRLETVTPLEGIEASFRLLPGAPAQVFVENLNFRAGGGSYRVRNALLDPASDRLEASLEVISLDLAELFKTLKVENLSGSGRMTGVIPVVIEGDDVVIKNGRLESMAPGVLRYRSSQIPTSLPPDADALELFSNPLDLTLRALENFEFDSLAIEVEKKATGDAQLLLRLAGKNPDLLEGYPFNLNVNLAGNVNPLLDALSQGLKLSDELFSQAWKLGP